jgi:pimeloyl-ACP methyl ester carboxylesterase
LTPDINQKPKQLQNSEHIGRYVDANGRHIHYLEQGSGEALLLIHSLGQSLFTWHRVIDVLSDHYRVVAVDLPGHGYSDKSMDEAAYAISALADTLVAFMDELGIETAHVIAFSMGGMIALDMAARFPNRIRRLVLICPGGITGTMPYQIRSLESPLTGWLTAATISPKSVANLLTDAFFDRTLITPEMVREYYKPYADKATSAALRVALRAFDEEDVMPSLRDIVHDVLIVWGVDDRWREVASAEVFHIALPRAQFALIRNCGHVLHEEKPERFLDYALDFLEHGIDDEASD